MKFWWKAPVSTRTPLVDRLSLVHRPVLALEGVGRRAIPRLGPSIATESLGWFAARSIPIESLGRRRTAPPDRSAVCVFIARSRCIAHCPPPRGCALTRVAAAGREI